MITSPNIESLASHVFFFFFKISGALYEHKQVSAISYGSNSPERVYWAWKNKEIYVWWIIMNYFLSFALNRRRSWYLASRPGDDAAYPPPSWNRGEFGLKLAFENTEKNHNICFTNIRIIIRDRYGETLTSVGTTWALSCVRTRVPCGCASTGVMILLPNVIIWYSGTKTSSRPFFFYKTVLECALEWCAHTPHISRRREQRWRHNVSEPSTYISRTSDSLDPDSAKIYGILSVIDECWHIITRRGECPCNPPREGDKSKYKTLHDSTWRLYLVRAWRYVNLESFGVACCSFVKFS